MTGLGVYTAAYLLAVSVLCMACDGLRAALARRRGDLR